MNSLLVKDQLVMRNSISLSLSLSPSLGQRHWVDVAADEPPPWFGVWGLGFGVSRSTLSLVSY